MATDENPCASEPYEPGPFAAYGDEDGYVDSFDCCSIDHPHREAFEPVDGSFHWLATFSGERSEPVVLPPDHGSPSSEVHDWWLERRLRRAEPEQRRQILAEHFTVLALTKQ